MHLYLFSNQEQLRLLLQSLLLGAGAGLLYDALRALRRQTGCGRAMTAMLDAVFWLVLSAAVFRFGLVFAPGQARFFVLAGAFCGAGLYFAALSGAVLAVFAAVLSAAARALRAAAAAAQGVQNALHRAGLTEKIIFLTKKFGKSSSLFRRKGIK